MKGILSVLAVLMLLGAGFVAAEHMTTSYGSTDNNNDFNGRTSDSGRAGNDCDVNPYDSIDTCASGVRSAGDETGNRMLTSDSVWNNQQNGRQTVSDSAGQWMTLQCRVAEDRTAVSDRGETSSTFGRTTAGNASGNRSANNAFDRENTGDTWGTQRTQTGSSQDSQRVNTADMEMLECYIMSGTSAFGRTTVSDTSVRSTGSTWSDMYDYNNPNRMTTEGNGERVQSNPTRGFESPVVYSGTLNTQRTADDVDANDAVSEDGSISRTETRTGSAD